MTESSGNPPALRGDIVFAFALVLAGYVAWLIRDELVLLYVSALFAVVLTPLVRAIGAVRIRGRQPFRRVALLLLLLGVAAALTAFGALALPPVVRDLNGFTRDMPARLPGIMDKVRRLPFAQSLDFAKISSQVQGMASHAATYLLLSIGGWAGKLFNIAMGLVLTIYFIAEGDRAYRWFLSFFPPARRQRLDQTLQRARLRMGRWLLGQGSLMLILGACSTVVYLSFHVRYAYALGVLTGLLNIIPVLGAAASIALALLVAAVDSWTAVAGIAIFYAIYLQIENSYLVPRIMQSRVGLPNLATLVALLLGSAIAGVVGAMVAVPTAVLVTVLLDEYLVNKEPADNGQA